MGLNLTPKEYGDKMREDPKFLLGTAEEIKKRYEEILEERIQPQLSKYFRKLPEAKLRLVLMDGSRAAGPAAYYIQVPSFITAQMNRYMNFGCEPRLIMRKEEEPPGI